MLDASLNTTGVIHHQGSKPHLLGQDSPLKGAFFFISMTNTNQCFNLSLRSIKKSPHLQNKRHKNCKYKDVRRTTKLEGFNWVTPYNDKQNTDKSSGRKTVGRIDRNFHLGNMDHSVAKREYLSGRHLSMWILHHMLTVGKNSSGFVTR